MRYLEDLAVGQRLALPSVTTTEADMIKFASRYDPQPMHLDAQAAAKGPLGGLAASGWQTAAMVMRLIVDANPFDGAPVLGMGVDELRWPTPVRPGDTISGEMEVLSITPSHSKPTHGVARVRTTARNQNGEVVLSMITSLWVPRRPASESLSSLASRAPLDR